uniref:RHS repeat domain-containing protein n=1 Tax=Caenimonas koreensis TaxID=367474 RepID=UPI0037844005
KKSFGWLFSASTTTTGAGLGTAYVYGDGPIPAWAMLGEYDNGSAVGKGRTEYIWLLTQDGQALPVGMYRNGKFYAVHADHLGTPRLITDEANKPVWQWPYSAFGNNTPTGVLQSTPNPKQAITNQPVLLKATKPIEMNLRFPGQYFDAETGLFYNWHRHYCARCGRYIQSDSIGLDGGINTFGYAAGAPTSYTDPTGQFVPLLLAPLLAPAWAPALAYGTAALATAAAVAMTLAPPPDYSPWSPDPEKNKEFIRDRDGVNDVKPVPYKDPSKPTCDEIRERIRFLEDIVARRVALTNKWYSGVFNPGHAGRVDTLRRDIDKLRARLARGDCAPC